MTHAATLAWTVFCTWLLLMPASDLGGSAVTAETFEELGHAGLIFVLAWLLFRSLRRWSVGRPWANRAGEWAILGAAAYAVLTEILQAWVPGRGFEWVDLAASVVGALVAAELPGVLPPAGER